MSFMDKCRAILIDPHPERDETHAATRYGLYETELPLQPELMPAQDTLDQKFEAFAMEHRDYLDAIQITAWDMIHDGATYLSMRDIIGVLRSQGIIINNSFTSRYTDRLIEREPRMAEYFHRRARAKGKMALHYAK